MNTTIIGRKVPCDLWHGDIKKDSVYVVSPDGDRNYGLISDSRNENFYMPAEIVETWEPVYEYDMFTVGDWVVYDTDSLAASEKSGVFDQSMILQVDKIQNNYLWFNPEQFLKYNTNFNDICGRHKSLFRKASQEEIEEISQLSFSKDNYLYCIHDMHGAATKDKVYECYNNCSFIGDQGHTHIITTHTAYHHFRIATKAEIEEYKFITLFFGDVKFSINTNTKEAISDYGKLTYKELYDVIQWIENPPTICGFPFTIHSLKNKSIDFNPIQLSQFEELTHTSIGFGCKSGKLSELKAILRLLTP